MNVDLEHLIVLQAEDLELKRLREELAAAPRKVAAAEALRSEAESVLKRVRESQAREEALRRRQGSDADDHRNKAMRLRKQLAGATSAAQITALEHEITFAESAVRTLEDEELASLERTEELDAQLAPAEQAVEKKTAALATEKARSAELTRAHGVAIAATEAERKSLRGLIAEGLLSTYDRVSKARGTGLAEARDGQCTACRMKVRPQRWNDLIGRDHEDEIFACETCGRALYYDPRRNAPGEWLAGDRLAAARALAEGKA